MISLENIVKFAGGRQILHIPHLTVQKGERLVIIGANGSGKTTLLRILAGTLSPDEGHVCFDDDIGLPYYMPQHSLGFSLSVLKNLKQALPRELDKEQAAAAADHVLRRFGLEGLKHQKGHRLSGGETQRLALARLLITPKKLLILDEPSSAADIESTDIIETALLSFCQDNTTTLIASTHSPRQALNIATKVLLLENGQIAESGPPEDLLNHPETTWGKRFVEHWK